jgi:hypothetical protein
VGFSDSLLKAVHTGYGRVLMMLAGAVPVAAVVVTSVVEPEPEP